MKKTIYLSGCFTEDRKATIKSFEAKDLELTEDGLTVLSAVKFIDDDARKVIRERLKTMFDADELHLMPDWNKSWAALIERNVAMAVHMEVIYIPKPPVPEENKESLKA